MITPTLSSTHAEVDWAKQPSSWRGLLSPSAIALSSGVLLPLLSKVLALLNTFLITRLTLPYLGTQRFGALATVISLGAFMAFADLGFGQSLVNAAARTSRSDFAQMERLRVGISSAFFSLSIIAIVIIAVLAAVFVADSVFPGRTAYQHSVLRGLLLFALSSACALPFSIAAKLLLGFQEYWALYRWQLFMLLVSLGAVLCASQFRMHELWIMACIVIPPAIGTVLTACTLFLGERSWLRPTLDAFDKSAAFHLLVDGATPVIAQAASSVLFTAPIWCFSALFGATSAATFYAVFRLTSPLIVMSTMITIPLWPLYAARKAAPDGNTSYRLLRLSILSVLAVHLCGFALLFPCFNLLFRSLTGGILAPTRGFLFTVGVLGLLMSIRQSVSVAAFGNETGGMLTNTAFLCAVIVSVALTACAGVFKHPYQVLLIFISIEAVLIGAMSRDSARLAKKGATGCELHYCI